MCPPAGQLLLLRHYRRGNPVTRRCSVLLEIHSVSWDDGVNQGQPRGKRPARIPKSTSVLVHEAFFLLQMQTTFIAAPLTSQNKSMLFF